MRAPLNRGGVAGSNPTWPTRKTKGLRHTRSPFFVPGARGCECLKEFCTGGLNRPTGAPSCQRTGTAPRITQTAGRVSDIGRWLRPASRITIKKIERGETRMNLKRMHRLSAVSLLLLLGVFYGCAGREYAPNRGVMYYHKELPAADRAVEAARAAGKDKECPAEFAAAEKMKNDAYAVSYTHLR